jgi:hypothetical protein
MARASNAHPFTAIARVTLLAAALACAGAPLAPARAEEVRGDDWIEGPGPVHPSIEAAALDALATAHRTATPRQQRQLRVGTIHRVAHGYSCTAPQPATRSYSAMPQRVRYRLHRTDVASYVIPPRTATRRRAQATERPFREANRIVGKLDPLHRPIYVLSESLEVVRYSSGERAHVVDRLSTQR